MLVSVMGIHATPLFVERCHSMLPSVGMLGMGIAVNSFVQPQLWPMASVFAVTLPMVNTVAQKVAVTVGGLLSLTTQAIAHVLADGIR